MKRIYAIVVIYNPDVGQLKLSLDILKQDVSRVIVCNNSSYEIDLGDPSFTILNFGENLGIAKAQSIGMKLAFDDGADFILQMDQDSIPEPNMVSKLESAFNRLRDNGIMVGLIGPVDYDRDTMTSNKPRINRGKVLAIDSNLIAVDSTLSSGSLIPRDAYELVGGMSDDLFIDAVDFDYCWRLKQKGFTVIRCLNAHLLHRLGEGSKLLFGLVSVRVPSPIRHYYTFRNVIYLIGKKHPPLYWKLSNAVKLVLKYVCYRFLFEDGSVRLKYMKLGIKDGVTGRLGVISKML
jgi:rhamnosyltransferase